MPEFLRRGASAKGCPHSRGSAAAPLSSQGLQKPSCSPWQRDDPVSTETTEIGFAREGHYAHHLGVLQGDRDTSADAQDTCWWHTKAANCLTAHRHKGCLSESLTPPSPLMLSAPPLKRPRCYRDLA